MTLALAPRNPSHGGIGSEIYEPVEIIGYKQHGRDFCGVDEYGLVYPMRDLRAYDEIYLARRDAIRRMPAASRRAQDKKAAADLRPFSAPSFAYPTNVTAINAQALEELGGAE